MISSIVILLVVILILFSLYGVQTSSQKAPPSFNIDNKQSHFVPSNYLSSTSRNSLAVKNISTSGEQSRFLSTNGLINSPIYWSAIGPKDIPEHLQPEGPSYNESGSGKVLAFAVDYSDPSVMYVDPYNSSYVFILGHADGSYGLRRLWSHVH